MSTCPLRRTKIPVAPGSSGLSTVCGHLFNVSIILNVCLEMRRGAVNSGRSDIHGMAKELDAGLFWEPLMDPAT